VHNEARHLANLKSGKPAPAASAPASEYVPAADPPAASYTAPAYEPIADPHAVEKPAEGDKV
jgi:hypothetical protein